MKVAHLPGRERFMPRRNDSWKKRSKATDLCSCRGVDLVRRERRKPYESSDNFDDKLRRQLEGSPRRADASDGGGVGKVEEAGACAQDELERAKAVLQD